jgi:aminoglycoside phosphotransferase (APT) family kinase protein
MRGALVDDLLTVVRRTIGDSDVEFAAAPEALTGGFWARLVSFQLLGAPPDWSGPLVARVMPDAATAAKETAFQGAVAAQGYPTPRVLAAGGPGEGIDGQAYLVMELAPGRPLLAGLDGVRVVTQLPSLVRRLPATLADVLAHLHQLDPAPAIHALDAAGVGLPDLPSMLALLEETAVMVGRSDLAAAAASLATRRPREEGDLVLCHGDLHPFNLIVADDGRVTVLDWSTAVVAPAGYDVGFTSLLLAEPPVVVPRPLQPIIRRAGRLLSRRFVQAYERAAGPIDDDTLAWYQAIACLRALVEVAGWVAVGGLDAHVGHPWLVAGDAFAARLSQRTGVAVRAH